MKAYAIAAETVKDQAMFDTYRKVVPETQAISRSFVTELMASGTGGVAGAADVRVRLEVWPDMIHVWQLFYQQVAAGHRALAEAGAFIRANWG